MGATGPYQPWDRKGFPLFRSKESNMANEKLPPIEGELTDEDLKQVCGGSGCRPTNVTGHPFGGQNQQGNANQNGNSQGP
jgi:hypothetical protein